MFPHNRLVASAVYPARRPGKSGGAIANGGGGGAVRG